MTSRAWYLDISMEGVYLKKMMQIPGLESPTFRDLTSEKKAFQKKGVGKWTMTKREQQITRTESRTEWRGWSPRPSVGRGRGTFKGSVSHCIIKGGDSSVE